MPISFAMDPESSAIGCGYLEAVPESNSIGKVMPEIVNGNMHLPPGFSQYGGSRYGNLPSLCEGLCLNMKLSLVKVSEYSSVKTCGRMSVGEAGPELPIMLAPNIISARIVDGKT